MLSAVIRYRAAGFAGTAAGRTGIEPASTTLTFAALRWGHVRRDRRGPQVLAASLTTLTVALRVAAGWILAVRTPSRARQLPTLAAALPAWRSRIRPPAPIGAGALGDAR